MARFYALRAEATALQVAGVIRGELLRAAGIVPRQRRVSITPERIEHIRRRHPQWLAFCLSHIPTVLAEPDYIGRRRHGDRRRVEFVGLVGRPPRWLLVSVKFLDDKREAWVNSAYPFGDEHLTGRLRTGTLWRVIRGP
jgi:hypothetical protein